MKDYKSGVQGDSKAVFKAVSALIDQIKLLSTLRTVVKHVQIHRNKILNHFLS